MTDQLPTDTADGVAADVVPGGPARKTRATKTIGRMAGPTGDTPAAPRTSALDVIAPVADPAGEPQDAMAALLASVETSGLSEDDARLFVELRRWQRRKAESKAETESMGKAISKRTAELLELRLEREWIPKLPANIVGEDGELLSPFTRSSIYPKFRDDPETGKQYTRGDLVRVLHDAELAHLIEPNYDADKFAAVIRDQVKAWRHQISETSAVNAAGDLIDAFGNVLTAEEAEDPTADALGVHPALRPFVEPVTAEEIRFTVR